MKKVTLLLFSILSLNGFAQKPEKVYSIVKEIKEVSWYKEQANLWEAETKSDNKNANAWYNYYSAIRALKNLSPWDSEERDAYYNQCEEIANNAYKAVPNTFEGNHLMWWQADNDKSKAKYLYKAYDLNPNDVRTYSDIMIQSELNRNKAKFVQFAKKYFNANDVPGSVYNWGYNILSELEENAILFTHGDNDTYATWVTQIVHQHRTDVQVINTSLILKDEYRNKLFKEMGIDFNKSGENIKSKEEFQSFKKELFASIINNGKRPVYTSVSSRKPFEKEYNSKMFITGLAYKFSENQIDNISVIRRNYEKKYLLDYLTATFAFNKADKISNNFNAMYLPSFVKLYKHYKATEETEKMKKLETYIINISKKSGKESEIYEILGAAEESAPNKFNKTLLNTKEIEKNFVKTNDNIYFGIYEVTNAEYNKFLNNVLSSRELDLFKSCLYDSSQWVENFPHATNAPMANMYHWHPAYADYPIVNIKHSSAKKYCEWLTQQYNQQSKRKYSKVTFRLPTKKEWEHAARAGDKNVKTPFPNDNFEGGKNGCYLANIKTGEGRFYDDGGFFTVKVNSYPPNKFGLYNIIGNAGEMIDEPFTSKGGNWFLERSLCLIGTAWMYEKEDPRIGFRVVMEIIEE